MSEAPDNLQALKRWTRHNHEVYDEGGDLEAALALIPEMFDPEVEFSPWLAREIEHGTYRGHDGVRRFFEELRDMLGPVAFAPEEFHPLTDDLIVVFTRLEGIGQQSDVPVGTDLGLLYEFHDGLVIRLTAFGSHEEALSAGKEKVAAQAR